MSETAAKVYEIKPTILHQPRLTRVAAYARVSSVKDAMHHSLSAQVSYYSDLIQKHPGWQYCGVYADEGITGTKECREDFQRMLNDCRAGKLDMIITKSISRFARNTLTLLETARELKSLGVPDGMTGEEIYNKIIERKLYVFNTKTPISVVNWEIRRHCENLSFATSSKNKVFSVIGEKGGRAVYALENSKTKANPIENKLLDENNSVPEEKVEAAYKEHIETVSSRLIDTIITCSPSFFEHLVIDLLLAMGYGSDKESGVVIGRSHDGGIDGVISEDRLGLDQIYIQAKRYTPGNTVGRKELQSFVGAMQNINKGVFITTSSFTKEAKKYAVDQQQKNLRLIDGQELAKYMIKYQVGIVIKKRYEIVDIDSDYFE